MELLVVVSVVAILSGVIIKSLNTQGVQRKARDARRASDLKKIQGFLEVYFADNRQYPTDLDDLVDDEYTNEIPEDPNGGPYAYYSPDGTQGEYVLAVNMEVTTSASESECSSQVISDLSLTDSYCYMVTSPVCSETPE